MGNNGTQEDERERQDKKHPLRRSLAPCCYRAGLGVNLERHGVVCSDYCELVRSPVLLSTGPKIAIL